MCRPTPAFCRCGHFDVRASPPTTLDFKWQRLPLESGAEGFSRISLNVLTYWAKEIYNDSFAMPRAYVSRGRPCFRV
jgi:hypothetical protein